MIKINEKYFIDADNNNFVLKEYLGKRLNKKTNEKEDAYEIWGYYNTIESALKGLVKRELRKFISKQEINSLNDLQQKIDDLHKFIAKKLKNE
jgi:hypothetical protein